MPEPTAARVHGWYGPPNSRRWHYFGFDGRSLCGKWFVLAWSESLVSKAFGPADGDCAACKRKLETSEFIEPGPAAVIDALGARPMPDQTPVAAREHLLDCPSKSGGACTCDAVRHALDKVDCPFCGDAACDEVRRALEQACKDLQQAHNELMVAQGCSRDDAPKYDWPRWTPQANTIRWAERLLGKPLGKRGQQP